MEIALGLFIASTVALIITSLVYWNKYKVTKTKLDRLREDHFRERREYQNKIDIIQKRKIRVGSVFYYPTNLHFVEKVAGKRAKIVEITQDKVVSRLVDENDNFIDNMSWKGSVSSAMNYIFVGEVNSLKHEFV